MDWAFWLFVVPAAILVWAVALGVAGLAVALFKGWRP